MPTVMAGGGQVHYWEAGDGPQSLLILHAWGCAPAFWEGPMAALAPIGHSYLIDLYGEGKTDRPRGGYTISGFADLAADFAGALGLGPLWVAGHSLGGVVAQQFAIRYPDRLTRLVLCGTGPTMRGHKTAPGILKQFRETGKTRELMGHFLRLFIGSPIPEADFERYLDQVMAGSAAGYEEAVASLLETDLVADLPKIQVPTLVCHGLRDTGRRMEHAETLQRSIPHCRLELFDTGHSMMIEEPERFIQVLREFLA